MCYFSSFPRDWALKKCFTLGAHHTTQALGNGAATLGHALMESTDIFAFAASVILAQTAKPTLTNVQLSRWSAPITDRAQMASTHSFATVMQVGRAQCATSTLMIA